MKVTIHYEYDSQYPDTRFAYIEDKNIFGGSKIFAGGEGWEEAKENLMRRVLEEKEIIIPPDEEIEI